MTTVKIYPGDCRQVLATLADESVHCVVTSPPYYGLRDYKVEPSVWGGDAGCHHDWSSEAVLVPHLTNLGNNGSFANDRNARRTQTNVERAICSKCGAWRGALGLEPTVEMYVAHMVEIFGEVRRVLRKDGTLWLNMGDSYVSAPPGNKGKFNPKTDKDGVYKRRGIRQLGHGEDMSAIYAKAAGGGSGLKQKDLVGMPWRLALALQADGWYLRQDIIWHKPNPMPESTTDRCTKSHEYFFMLSKSARYYYDQEAIVEPVAATSVVRISGGSFAAEQPGERDHVNNAVGSVAQPNNNSVFRAMKNFARKKPLTSDGLINTFTDASAPSKSGNKTRKPATVRGVPVADDGGTSGAVAGSVPWEGWTRNKRSVWTVPVEPFPGSHFAVFPPALVRPAILAGCPQRVCSTCGAPMVRQALPNDGQGWQPTCKHNAAMVSGVVLDPFGGSGTVADVAATLDRDAVLIELSPEYVDMIAARLGRPSFLAPIVEIIKRQVARFIPEKSSEQKQRSRRDHQASGG